MTKKVSKKEYYNLKELKEFVDLKDRQLKYRVKEVAKKYKNQSDKISRGKRSWRIHKSIIFEFDRKRLSNAEREMMKHSLVTINPDGNYDIDYNKELLGKLIQDLIKVSPVDLVVEYFIEQGEWGDKYHIHFVTNLKPSFSRLIQRHANYYTKTNCDVRCVYEEWQLYDYLQKDIKEQGEFNVTKGTALIPLNKK